MDLLLLYEMGRIVPLLIVVVLAVILLWLIFVRGYLILPRLKSKFEVEKSPGIKQRLDENVQFTVYRPRAVEPERWYSFIVYAHLSERRFDTPSSEPHPTEEVNRMAREALGEKFLAYSERATDSQQAIPQEGVLVFVAAIEGIEFLPERHMILWEGPLHELKFKMRAERKLEGNTARGFLRVYLGIFLVAEMPLTILVDTERAREYGKAPSEPGDIVSPYRKIFASYSHKDELMVVQFEQLVEAFGDEYLRDVRDIRAGEEWNKRLEELIREADIFQLFWSRKSMTSKFVRSEWEYALSLNKPNFIRPTFWEEPMPTDEKEGLPPEALLRLQFKRAPEYIGSPTPKKRFAGKTIGALLVLFMLAVTVPLLPNLFVHRRASNDASAQATLRTIFLAEKVYSDTAGEGKFGTLAELGTQSLIDPILAQGKKSGYIFTIIPYSQEGAESKFEALAEPQTSETGTRSFYIDERGILYQKKGLKAGTRSDPGSPLE